MQKWYSEITPGQKVLLFSVSYFAILFYGLGLIPLLGLIYMELGSRKI